MINYKQPIDFKNLSKFLLVFDSKKTNKVDTILGLRVFIYEMAFSIKNQIKTNFYFNLKSWHRYCSNQSVAQSDTLNTQRNQNISIWRFYHDSWNQQKWW
jgi:hypothetical protein